MNKIENILNKIINWGVILLTFLLPLFFLPLTTEFYDFNKNLLLYFVTGLLLLAWIAKIGAQKEIKLVKNAVGWPIFGLVLAFIAATIFASPNKIEALLFPGATGTVIALALLYLIIKNNLQSSESRTRVLLALTVSASLLALLAIYQFIGLGETITKVAWLKSRLWTAAGNPLSLATFLLVVLPIPLVAFWKKFSQSVTAAILPGLSSILILIALIITISQILPGKPTAVVILPYPSSWEIAVEAFKQNPLLGVGPENFVSAFNRFRPITFNRYDFWNARFTVSPNYPLHLLTVTGILGLVAFGWLVLKVIRAGYPGLIKKNSVTFSLFLTLLVFLVLPNNLLVLFTFFLLLAISEGSKPIGEEKSTKIPLLVGRVMLIIGCLLVGTAFYFAGRAWMAEASFKNSLDHLTANRGVETYNAQIQAIKLNSRQVDFRIAYSQVNFGLANSLAQKAPLTDQDRANISQLIQQAIREAKAATVLNPTNSATWENLANLYRNLINFAQDADQWAIAAYQQAIKTDPINPRLRLNLGGLFYALGDFDAARRQFEDVISLKSDFANGYYNLAAVYREEKKYSQAYQAMQMALNLIPADSADWQTAKSELDELAKNLPSPQPTPTPKPAVKPEESLNPPQPIPSQAVEPPIELPPQSAPEIPSPVPTE